MPIDNKQRLNSNSDEITIKDLILSINRLCKYLMSKWVLIFAITLIGSILGLVYSVFNKPVYKAELSFAIEDEKSSSGGIGTAMGLASQFGIDLGGSTSGAFSSDNLLALMKSRTMVEKTLLSTIVVSGNKETLAELYIKVNNLHEKWKKDPKIKNVDFPVNIDRSKFSLKQDSILGSFFNVITKTILTVENADKKSSILLVTVKSTNEFFSKYFAEQLVETVSDFYVETKTKKSVQNVNILQRQTDSVRRELNAAINGVASSVDFNPNANPSLQILRAPSQRRQVDVQANSAILNQLVANLEIAKITLRKETPLIQIIDKPIFPLEKISFGKLKGIILGGFLFGFLVTLYLIIKKMLKNIIS